VIDKKEESFMSIVKIMEILDQFEIQAARDIEQDHAIDADPYESVGRHILIGKIRKRIIKEADINDDKEAA
jgi:hypothetical protein